MAPKVARLIGGAGTGKTLELLRIMEKAVEQLDNDPHRVGFVSFTRAACDEAATRAADAFNRPRGEFREAGWFKTIHGIAFRCLGIKDELLADDAAGRKWVEEAMGEPVKAIVGEEPGDNGERFAADSTAAAKALELWGYARNRIAPLMDVHREAERFDPGTPPWHEVLDYAQKYEQAKRLDCRADFTDLLARFAGWSFRPDAAPEQVTPEGDPPPQIEAWILDEAQDNAPLTDNCFRRLLDAPTVRWGWLSGDPFQAIYGWNGGDHRLFTQGYAAAKERIMPKSWRCAAEILALGEDILTDCSDYFDRRIAPAGPGGEIEKTWLGTGWPDEVAEVYDARHSTIRGDLEEWAGGGDGKNGNGPTWLLLARTNYEAGRLARRLDDINCPWLPTKRDAGCRWKAPAKLEVIAAMLLLQTGGWIDGAQWQRCLDYLPTKQHGVELLTRGTKAVWADIKPDDAKQRWPWLQADGILAEDVGATQALLDRIRSGAWVDLIKGGSADRLAEAVQRLGLEAVRHPRVRVGTIHSAKGMEADNVGLLTNVSLPVVRGMEDQGRSDEEARVWYVGVTRARSRLLLIRDQKARWQKRLPV